jgi:hypothetical protein
MASYDGLVNIHSTSSYDFHTLPPPKPYTVGHLLTYLSSDAKQLKKCCQSKNPSINQHPSGLTFPNLDEILFDQPLSTFSYSANTVIIFKFTSSIRNSPLLNVMKKVMVPFITILSSLPQMHSPWMTLHQEWRLHGIEDPEHWTCHKWWQD